MKATKLRGATWASILAVLILFSCSKDDDLREEEVSRGAEFFLSELRTPDTNYIMVAAHRGDWRNHPENSLSAIQSCIDLGLDIVEIDIRITLDHELVVFHDKELERMTNGQGPVSFRTLSYLKTLQLKDLEGNLTDEAIPTLEEALLLAKGQILVMLDKSELLIPEVYEVLKRTGMTDQVLFIGFEDTETTEESYVTEVLDSSVYIPGIHKTLSDPQTYVDDFESWLDPEVYALWVKSEDSALMQYFQTIGQKGKRVWVNATDADQCAGHSDHVSVSDPDNGWGWIIDQGGTIIMTDQPQLLKDYLELNNLRK